MLYYDINELLEKGDVFSFIIGGRGTGKAEILEEVETKGNAVDNGLKVSTCKTLP